MTTWLIGRHSTCDIVIDDATVSRRHAELSAVAPQVFLLDDKGSTSGTFLLQAQGWKRVVSARVKSQDRVRLGGVELSIDDLLRRRASTRSEVGGTVERDPETGEIVVRRR